MAGTDTSSATGPSDPANRAGDALIDVGALREWLVESVGDPTMATAPLTAERIGQATGVGNALFFLHWGERQLVLRRPPGAKITASAGDMTREARLLGALAGTEVRHPRLVGSCSDTSVIGAPFLVMERIDGFTPVAPLPEPFASDAECRGHLGLEIVDALAELALVNWRSVGLVGFGKPDGFLARQVDRWLWQLDSYRTRELPGLDALSQWLRDELPAPGPVGIVHGDYSTFNVMFAHDRPVRLAAIIDWDTATIGEPLMDLGHLLARWDQTDEEPTELGAEDNPDRTGLAPRHVLAERYAARTGFDLTNLRYYEVVSLFKLACIMEGHHATEITTVAPDARRFTETSLAIIRDALRIADGARP